MIHSYLRLPSVIVSLQGKPFIVKQSYMISKQSITICSYILAVVLKITGFASTYWTDDTTDSDNKTTTRTYSGHEDYIRSKVELLSSNRKGKYCQLKCFI